MSVTCRRILTSFGGRRLLTSGNSENIAAMRNSAAFYCLFVATASLASAPAIAQEALLNEPAPTPQQRFVSDKLVLNVYAEPEQGSTRVATIQTGDAVQELERSGTQVRVRLDDGREGWVGANYLVADAPAIVRLRELQRQQSAAAPAPRTDKASIEEIAQLKKQNAALLKQVSDLQSRAAAPPAKTEQPVEPERVAPLVESAAFAGTTPRDGIIGWVFAVMLVGAASFVGGYQTLARRLRKKFGGLKIY